MFLNGVYFISKLEFVGKFFIYYFRLIFLGIFFLVDIFRRKGSLFCNGLYILLF